MPIWEVKYGSSPYVSGPRPQRGSRKILMFGVHTERLKNPYDFTVHPSLFFRKKNPIIAYMPFNAMVNHLDVKRLNMKLRNSILLLWRDVS